MNTLDLHGIRHEKVENLVEDFILCEDMPVRIITGNSNMMHSLVGEVIKSYGYTSEPETDWNLGSLIVMDK